MQNKAIAALLTSMMLVSMVPVTSAETISDHYDLTLGARVVNAGTPKEGLTLSWTPFGDCVDDIVDDSCEVPGPNIGGGQLTTEAGDVYSQVVVSTKDDNFDATYMTACVIIQSGEVFDNYCDDDGDDFSSSSCGPVQLNTPGPLFGGENPVVMFVSTVVLQADTLEPCFASQGDLVGVFS